MLKTLSILLGLIFIVLKLISVISWSWIWVLSPFWIYCVIYLLARIYIEICKAKHPEWFIK